MIENNYKFVDEIFSYTRKRKHKIQLFILTFIMLISSFTVFVPPVSAVDGLAISSVTDLENIPDYSGSVYYLTTDIDFADKYTEGPWSDWNGGSGWDPINSFRGVLDGRGYSIKNLYINRPDEDNIGLFSEMDGEGADEVYSVDFEDVDITGKNSVGAIVGTTASAQNVDIYCCNVTGTISGSTNVGGVFGSVGTKTNVEKVYSGCDVTGSDSVGGLVGLSSGSLYYCFVNGTITGSGSVGGLVGTLEEGEIKNCYSMSPTSGSSEAGGIVGYYNSVTTDAEVSYCWCNGSATGFFGSVSIENIVYTSNFIDEDTSECTETWGATGKPTTQMHDIETYTDIGSPWSIALYADYTDEIWYINNPHDYPHLGWEFDAGAGTDYGPLLPAGNITTCVYNESNNSQQIPFSIFITNQEGTETYESSTQFSNCITLPTSQLPRGDDTIFIIESPGYKLREYLRDVELGTEYNFTFYLPPLETTNNEDGDGDGEGDGEQECYLRSKTDLSEVSGTGDQTVTLTYPYESITAVSIYDSGEETVEKSNSDIKSVTNPSADVTITLDESPSSITSVYQYNNSLYVGWVSVPDDKYTLSGSDVTVDSSALDENSEMIRVDYKYEDYEYGYGEWVSVSNDDWSATSTTEITIDSSVYNKDSYTMSRVEYQYEYCEGVTQETLLYQIEVVGPQGEYSSAPISGVKLIFKRYNPNSDEFVEVASSRSDANGQVGVYLIPGVYYRVHLSKDDFVSDISNFIPNPVIQTKTFRIVPDLSDIFDSYNFYDLIDLEVDWYSDGFYVNYTDTTNSTVTVNFTIRNYSSRSIIHTELETNSTHNFTFNTTEGCNLSNPYIWSIECTLDNDTFGGTYYVGPPIFPIPDILNDTNRSDIDDIFDFVFGDSPLYNSESGISVPWTYIIVFAIAFIIFTTVGKLNGFLGFLGAGLVLVMAGGLISGLEIIGDGLGWQGPVTMVIGFFMVAVSFIGLIGGVEK